MGVTVAQALNIGGLKQGRLLAGFDHLNNVVEAVNIIEALMDTDWEAGWDTKNHLLLTTFYFARKDVQKQIRIMELFVRNGCSALVFQRGILPGLAPEVIQRAGELALPLIEVPPTVEYPAIITPLVGAILNEKTFLLQRRQEIHTRLTDLILTGRGLPGIAAALSELLNRPVVVTDVWGSVLASANPDGSLPGGLELPPLENERRRHEAGWDNSRTIWISPILSGGQQIVDGYILVRVLEGALDELDIVAIEQAATIAALDLVKQKAVIEAERRLKRDFIEDVLAGDYHSAEAILARARSLGWDLLHKQVVMLVDLNNFEQYYLAHRHRGETHFQQTKERFLQIVSAVMQEHNPGGIVVERSDSLILLPDLPEEAPLPQARRQVQSLSEAICTGVYNQLDGLTISVAVGGFYHSVEGLCNSYDEAKAALRVGLRLPQHRPIIWYSDVMLYVLLDRFALQPEARHWFGKTLQPLLEYDRQNNTELVRTLETYFDANQSLQQAARELFIHPKTLKYRLQRIEEILAANPFSGDRQLSYYLATKIARLL